MAAEQRGCRETLVVHSEWLSVREQQESEDRNSEEKHAEYKRWRVTKIRYSLLFAVLHLFNKNS